MENFLEHKCTWCQNQEFNYFTTELIRTMCHFRNECINNWYNVHSSYSSGELAGTLPWWICFLETLGISDSIICIVYLKIISDSWLTFFLQYMYWPFGRHQLRQFCIPEASVQGYYLNNKFKFCQWVQELSSFNFNFGITNFGINFFKHVKLCGWKVSTIIGNTK